MIEPVSYMEVLSEKYPNIKAMAEGDGTDYDALWAAEDGDSLPSKATLDADRDYYTRLRVWRLIQAERDRRKAAGIKVGTNWFHSDDGSRIQQLGLVIFGAALPPIQWKCLSGGFVTMTPALAQAIFQTTAMSDMAIFAVAEQHRVLLMASPVPHLYDFSGLWPPTYTGSLLL
jgi:Domain of unknown function (DUF4376)